MSIWGNPVMMGGSGGGSTYILSGTTNPSSAQGGNGEIYLKYKQFSLGWTADLQYCCETAGIIATINSRTYSKIDGTKALVAISTYNGAVSPFLASTDPDAVKYGTSEDAVIHGPDYDYTIGGITWYFTRGHYGYTDPTDVSSDFPQVNGLDFSTQAGAESFLQLANVRYQDTEILATYAKVNNAWQDLIGTDINDIDLGGGVGAKNVSIYGSLFKYCLLSTDSTDQFNRDTRWFRRNSAEPVVVLGSAFIESGSMTYTGYAVISFTGTAVTGGYSSYGDLNTPPRTATTPKGTTFYIQQMNGMYPPSTASNKIKIQYAYNAYYNTASVLEFIIDDTKLIHIAGTSTFAGDAGLLNAFYTLIDSVYQSYYA